MRGTDAAEILSIPAMPAHDAVRPFEILHEVALKPINPMKAMKKLLRFWT